MSTINNSSANRRVRRRPPSRSKGKGIANVVTTVLLSKAEHKYLTNTHASATASSPLGFVHTITQPIVTGDDLQQRDGRQITHLSTQLRFSVNLPALAVSGVLRVIWFIDKKNNGVTPAVLDVLNTASVTSGYNFNAIANKRFTIIRDTCYSLVAQASNQHITPVLNYVARYPIYYNGTTNVAASNGVGAQFCIVITDLGANVPIYSMDSLTRFIDM